MQRGTANTRWRDFADIYLLSGRHPAGAAELTAALSKVVEFRKVDLTPLRELLNGFADLAQPRWAAWVRKQKLGDRLPTQFVDVLHRVYEFADALLEPSNDVSSWDPTTGSWR